jgi:putative spermidine/putrescine transport system substrate-binding protein
MKKWPAIAGSIALFAALVLGFAYVYLTRPKPILTVVTWPESYGHAQASAQLVPFAQASGTDVRIAVYDGGTQELARQVASKRYHWDVIDFELPDAVAACDSGLLERIDLASLPAAPNGTPASEDFVPGALGPCYVGNVVYSQVIGVAPSISGGFKPSKLDDFFDLKRFPGKRALNRTNAKYNVEMALLADGVAAKDLYAKLSTPQGVSRALARLATIRKDIVWCTSASEAAQMLREGRAAMALMPNWAVFDANTQRPAAKLDIVWDRQLYEMEVFGIPKGNPKRDKAMDFVRFATQARNLGKMASWVAYGPARKSALGFVKPNPELKIDMLPYLPTAHFDTAVAVDDGWWRLHGEDVDVLWQAWIAKSP